MIGGMRAVSDRRPSPLQRLGWSGHLERTDRVLAWTLIALSAVTIVLILDPRLPIAVIDPQLDLVFHTAATLATGAVAMLALVRYREGGQVAGLFQAGGFLVLCLANGFNALVILTGLDEPMGFSLGAPGQFPVYSWALARLISGVLLAAGALTGVRVWRPGLLARRAVVLAPSLVLVIASVVLQSLGPSLPALLDANVLRLLATPGTATHPLPDVNLGVLLLDGLAGVILLLGTALYHRRTREGGPATDAYLAIGLLVAAFSQLHFVLYPAVYNGLVSTGDVLRVGFYALLLVGIQAEARTDLRALRTAYAALDRLRTADMERAAIEERTRIARDIHDGLAQDLWSAKLEHEKMGARLSLDSQTRLHFERTTHALDMALAEARHAVMTLRTRSEMSESLADELPRYAHDFGERLGLRVEYEADPLLRELSQPLESEVFRIAQEALNNVSKHADATVVRVRAYREPPDLVLTVHDNGRGFEPDEPHRGGVGLDSMRERAALLGGTLVVSSEPGGGTEVRLQIPLSTIGTAS